MQKRHIKNIFLGILTATLLAAPMQDVFAQRTIPRHDRQKNEKRVSRPKLTKKTFKEKAWKNKVRKERPRKQTFNNKRFDKRNNKNIKRFSGRKKRFYNKESRQWKQKREKRSSQVRHPKHYRKPSWIDYHHPRHYYPRPGSRCSVLPRGYISIRLGDHWYFTYHGTYYQYDPYYRMYVVVEKPVITTTYKSTKWDQITLADGSTIEGVYISGDDEIVLFEVGNAVLEIPLFEIKMITFAE